MVLEGGVDRVNAQKPKGRTVQGSGAKPTDHSEDSVDFIEAHTIHFTRSKRAVQMLGTARNPTPLIHIGSTSKTRRTGIQLNTEVTQVSDLETPEPPSRTHHVTIPPTTHLSTIGMATPLLEATSPTRQLRHQAVSITEPPEATHPRPIHTRESAYPYNWDEADLEIFQLLRQQIQRTRARTSAFLRTHEAMGLQHTSTEATDLQLLIRRVSPELQRFLPRFYPTLEPLPEPLQIAPISMKDSHEKADAFLPSVSIEPLPEHDPSVQEDNPDQLSQNQLEPEYPATVVAKLSPQLLAELEETFARKAKLMVMGHIRGKCPGAR